MKERVRYLDILKAFVMICVIIGHTSFEAPQTVIKAIYVFHMPVFFIISGYFFKGDRISREFVVKSVKGLILPYLGTVLVIIAIGLIKDGIAGIPVLPNVGKWLNAALYGSGLRTDWSIWPFDVKMIGAVWFFLALLWARLLLAGILSVTGGKRGTGILAATIACAGYLMSQSGGWAPLSIYAGMTAVFFVYLGYLARQVNAFDADCPLILYLVTILICVYVVVECEQFYMVSNEYGSGLMNVIGAVSASFLLIRAFRFLERRVIGERFARFAAYIGRHTALLLGIHTAEAKYLRWGSKVPDFFRANSIPANWWTMCAARLLLIFAVFAVVRGVLEIAGSLKRRHSAAR